MKQGESGTGGDRWGYTGREHDAGTEQRYHRARYFGEDELRWTQLDPIGFQSCEPNLFRFVGNSSTLYCDYTGCKRKIVIGVHSNIVDDDDLFNNPVEGGRTGGHSSISIWIDEKLDSTYGLWPDSNRIVNPNGRFGTDVRVNLEQDHPFRYEYGRYYELTEADYTRFLKWNALPKYWKLSYDCASYARDAIRVGAGIRLNADDWGLLGADTPAKLGLSIINAEFLGGPTSPRHPMPPANHSILRPPTTGLPTSLVPPLLTPIFLRGREGTSGS